MWFERTSVVFTFFESRFVIELMSIHSDFPIAFHNTDFFTHKSNHAQFSAFHSLRYCKLGQFPTRIFLIFLFGDFQENFFIRLLRGSGLKGLVSFYNYRNLQRNNINIVRPLLDFSKEDLLYVTKNTFNFYIDDPSNRSLEYLRSRERFMINNLKKSQ